MIFNQSCIVYSTTWDWPAAKPKHKPSNCVKIVNGKYIYDDLCEVPSSDSQAILPP